MTLEQTRRIVMVLNRIEWPKRDNGRFILDILDGCVFAWHMSQPHSEYNTLREEDARDIIESHFRKWLKKHWDEVDNHCTHGMVTLELVRYNRPGESCYHAEVVINTEGETDELELYLTAVERTLEQENAK